MAQGLSKSEDVESSKWVGHLPVSFYKLERVACYCDGDACVARALSSKPRTCT